MSSPIDELAEALAAFQAECPVIPKKQTAKIETQGGRNYSYTYADLATISPVVLPILAKHGLAFTALPRGGKDGPPMLVGMLIHKSGQTVRGELPITGRTPQEIGSSLTYGRRYLLGCLTGVVTDDDDDGHLAERSAKRTRKAPERSPGADPPPPVAPPVPIQRKRRQRATAGEDPAPASGSPHGSTVEDAEPGPAPDDTPMRDAQRRALFAAVSEALPDAERPERLALCSAVIGRPVQSSNELTMADASAILRWLDDYRAGREAWQFDPETELGYTWPTDPPPDDTGP